MIKYLLQALHVVYHGRYRIGCQHMGNYQENYQTRHNIYLSHRYSICVLNTNSYLNCYTGSMTVPQPTLYLIRLVGCHEMDGCIFVIAHNLTSIWELSAQQFRMIEEWRSKGTIAFKNTDTTLSVPYRVH